MLPPFSFPRVPLTRQCGCLQRCHCSSGGDRKKLTGTIEYNIIYIYTYSIWTLPTVEGVVSQADGRWRDALALLEKMQRSG